MIRFRLMVAGGKDMPFTIRFSCETSLKGTGTAFRFTVSRGLGLL
jgi:hypothetical protein